MSEVDFDVASATPTDFHGGGGVRCSSTNHERFDVSSRHSCVAMPTSWVFPGFYGVERSESKKTNYLPGPGLTCTQARLELYLKQEKNHSPRYAHTLCAALLRSNNMISSSV